MNRTLFLKTKKIFKKPDKKIAESKKNTDFGNKKTFL